MCRLELCSCGPGPLRGRLAMIRPTPMLMCAKTSATASNRRQFCLGAGDKARDSLIVRATSAGIEAVDLSPVRGDFNEDLRATGVDALRQVLRDQLRPEDVPRFMER